ncbi:nucleotidyltransferase domain-containing protein [Candidatus Nanohalococcus occultus]|uniref:nucleotidyltransferase domain-containing protein n=1 Tax=Candidatus Nanohalococcus occultus TaxID=2978047 RepID=UPI0039E0B769
MYIASDEEIQEFADKATELLGGRVQKIILYGSYARNEHTPGSDIDLLILVDEKKRDDRERVSKLAGKWFEERNLLFSATVLEVQDFNEKLKAGYSFHENVDDEGIEI